MGIDFLDCVFRIEKAFGLPSRAFVLDRLVIPRDDRGRFAVTCREMLDWVELTLRENGRQIPDDCWQRLQICIAGTVACPLEEVTLQSRLVQDLGFT